MGGAMPVVQGPKIKGGRWTVAKFFIMSVAYTSVWLAVSSELSHYRSLYGPQVLLHLNIAYYVPSIPLLIFQSFFDERLEAAFGVSRTILSRLIFGLVGYAAVSAYFPFMPQSETFLLGSVIALGAFSGIAFSASYQMVARFANKNVIALGVGFSASGPLVLLMQIAVGLKSTPTHRQHVILYLSIAALVVLGLWAAVSLLFRHWDAINSTGPPAEHDAEQPLLAEETGDITGSAAAGSDDVEVERLTPVGSSMGPLSRLTPDKKMRSMPRQLAYSLLEPYEQPYLSARREFTSPSVRLARRLSSPMKLPRDGAEAGHEEAADGRGGEGSHIAEGDIQRSVSAPAEWHHRGSGDGSDAESFYTVEDHHEDGVEGGVTGMMEVGRLIWPALIAIGLQAGIALTLFPFFTYIPSSGLLGDELPKVLFFGRIFADVAGRLLPRSKFFVPSSINAVLIIALCKLTAEPLFFVYLKTPERMHSDVFIIAYIVLMWGASGYVNTAANMCAPKMVPPALKSTAAALMAIVYQSGHFVGLVVATVLNLLMFPKH